jgi:Raf kinase inhibitor-like YbhB/YbcL family protein
MPAEAGLMRLKLARPKLVYTLAAVLAFAAGCAAARAAATPGFELGTASFQANGDIPARFTCEGANVSPALRWTNPPAGTASFALIVEDPDAPGAIFTHWIVYGLAPEWRGLPEGVANSSELQSARQGRNDFGKIGYGGPCPPPGAPHRYFFKLYALDSRPDLPAGASRAEFDKALRGHVLAHAEVMGRFRR